MPPFRGGTWQHSMRTAIGVNGSRGGQADPSTLRCRGKIPLQWLSDGTCGRTHTDSCAGVTPYCSLWPVGYDISCGSSDLLSPAVRRTRSGALAAPRRGLRDSARRDFDRFGITALSRLWPVRREGKSAMTVLTWTDDRVEQLKKLWDSGLSASQIAAELGNVTRNAVIGKVHRLGLSGRAKSPSSAAPRQRKARPERHMMRVARPVSRGNTALAHASTTWCRSASGCRCWN